MQGELGAWECPQGRLCSNQTPQDRAQEVQWLKLGRPGQQIRAELDYGPEQNQATHLCWLHQ